MKTLVAALFVLSAVIVAQAYIDRDYVIKSLERCKNETGATEDPVDIIDNKNIPVTTLGKCMLACYLKDVGTMKDDKLSVEGLKAFFDRFFSDNPPLKQLVQESSDTCREDSNKKENKCELAAAYFQCMYKTGYRYF